MAAGRAYTKGSWMAETKVADWAVKKVALMVDWTGLEWESLLEVLMVG